MLYPTRKQDFWTKRKALGVLLCLCSYFLGFQTAKTNLNGLFNSDDLDESKRASANLTCAGFDELSVPPPLSCRHYHRCNLETTPHISGDLETAQILRYTNYSFVGIGNGDIELLLGHSRWYQNSTEDLRKALLRTLKSDLPNMFVGLPDVFSEYSEHRRDVDEFYGERDYYRQYLLKHIDPNKQYLSTFVTTPFVYLENSFCGLMDAIYENLREIWRNQDIVWLRGNNKQVYQHDVFDTARSQKVILAPRNHAWSAYKNLSELLLKEDPNSLYVLTAGPVAKVLAYDLAKIGRRVLDLGHLPKDYNIYAGIRQMPGDRFWRD